MNFPHKIKSMQYPSYSKTDANSLHYNRRVVKSVNNNALRTTAKIAASAICIGIITGVILYFKGMENTIQETIQYATIILEK